MSWGVLTIVLTLIIVGALSNKSGPPASVATSTEEQNTAAAATAVSPARTPRTPTPPPQVIKPCGSEGQPDFGVSVNTDTSCPFAVAVLKAYVHAGWEPDAPKADTVTAYSPVTQKSYSMACAATSSNTIACTGGKDALVSFQIAAGTRVAAESEAAQQTQEYRSEGTDEVGSYSHAGDASFCGEHHCIGNFTTEEGTVVECADGTFSHAGGIYGSCSYHGGEAGGGGGQYSKGEESGEGEEESSPE
jgi:hypothetical protein